MGLLDMIRMGYDPIVLTAHHKPQDFYMLGIDVRFISRQWYLLNVPTIVQHPYWMYWGYGASQLKDGGYSAMDLLRCGHLAQELLDIGFNEAEVLVWMSSEV